MSEGKGPRRDATVIMAKCRETKRPFGIRTERRGNVWYCTWAFKLSEKAASSEGYGSTMVSGQMALDKEWPGCPYCGTQGWFSCGKCGKLTCMEDGEEVVICAWCGNQGGVEASDDFNLTGGGY